MKKKSSNQTPRTKNPDTNNSAALATATFEALSEGIDDFRTMVRDAPKRRWGTTSARIFRTSGDHFDLAAIVPIDEPSAIVGAVRAVTVHHNALAVAWAMPATFRDEERLMVFVELPDGTELRSSAPRTAGRIGRLSDWTREQLGADSWVSLPVNLPAWAAITEEAGIPVDGALLQAIAERDYQGELEDALDAFAECEALIREMEFEHPFRVHRDDRRCSQCRRYELYVIRTMWPDGPGIQFRLSGAVGVNGKVGWRFDMEQHPMLSCPEDDKSAIPMDETLLCLGCGASYSRSDDGRLALASARGPA